jgi:predicted oxidoreductase
MKNISKLIAGTMTWGSWGKKLSTNEMIDLIHFCIENNITTFDHAAIYGAYTTETDFGKAFNTSKINRDSVQFITKCGIQYPSAGNPYPLKHYNYSANEIIKSVENSLKNLQTDYIDILLLHRPSPLLEPNEVAQTIEKLKREGKIRAFGLSNFKPMQTELLRQKISIDCNQIQFSVTHFEAMLNDDLAYMQLQNISPMAWNPLGDYFNYETEQTKRLQPIVKKIAEYYTVSEEVILITWILKHPSGILPVVGTTQKTRIEALTKALTLPLSIEHWFELWTASLGSKVP